MSDSPPIEEKRREVNRMEEKVGGYLFHPSHLSSAADAAMDGTR
jgi:hypothetical protein